MGIHFRSPSPRRRHVESDRLEGSSVGKIDIDIYVVGATDELIRVDLLGKSLKAYMTLQS